MKNIKKVRRNIGIIGFTSFFLMLGIVGSIELDKISFADGMTYSIIFVSFFGLCVMASNALDEVQRKYNRIVKRLEELRMTEIRKPLVWERFTPRQRQDFIQTLHKNYDGLTEAITTNTPIFLLRKTKPNTREDFYIIEVHQTSGVLHLLYE